MTRGLWTLAGVLAVGAVAGRFYAVPLVAQVRAALVSDVDNSARNPVRITVDKSIGDAVECRLLDYTVPAGKRLVIDDISAATIVPSSGWAGMAMQILVSPNGASAVCDEPRQAIAAIPFRAPLFEGARALVSAHEQMAVTVNPGESIGLEIRNAAVGTSPVQGRYRMFVSGHLVSLP